MTGILLTVLNMSITAGIVILAVCAARLMLKKAPKIISYALWAVVAFRLIIPFSFESVFSLMPIKPNPIPQDIVYQSAPRIDTGLNVFDNAVSESLPASGVIDSVNPLQIYLAIGEVVWLTGIAVMLIYSVVTIIMLRRRLRFSKHVGGDIYEADDLKTPFVLGYFMPKIYIPAGLKPEEQDYIVLHEQTHIRRKDHIVKLFAYLVLCLHWFNPLVWAAFVLMGADMELSCDERVLKELGSGIKKDYSASLLSFSTGRRIINGSPLAFGEGSVKERLKNILNFRKPSRIIIIAAMALVVFLSVGFALNRSGGLFPITMNNVHKEPHFAGIVTEVYENSILVNVNEGEDARRSSDLINVPLDVKLKDSISKWFIDDEIIVYYDGVIMESYPAQVKTVYAIVVNDKPISINKTLMLDDLRRLAVKGNNLMFENFSGFRGVDASSDTGYHIMLYSVEGGYRLIVRSKKGRKPDSISLESIWEGSGSGIDIRYDDLDKFLRTHPSHPAITGEEALAFAEEYAGKKLLPIDLDWWEREDEFPHNSKDPFKRKLDESRQTLYETCELFMDTDGGFFAVGRKSGKVYVYHDEGWAAAADNSEQNGKTAPDIRDNIHPSDEAAAAEDSPLSFA